MSNFVTREMYFHPRESHRSVDVVRGLPVIVPYDAYMSYWIPDSIVNTPIVLVFGEEACYMRTRAGDRGVHIVRAFDNIVGIISDGMNFRTESRHDSHFNGVCREIAQSRPFIFASGAKTHEMVDALSEELEGTPAEGHGFICEDMIITVSVVDELQMCWRIE